MAVKFCLQKQVAVDNIWPMGCRNATYALSNPKATEHEENFTMSFVLQTRSYIIKNIPIARMRSLSFLQKVNFEKHCHITSFL